MDLRQRGTLGGPLKKKGFWASLKNKAQRLRAVFKPGFQAYTQEIFRPF
jgi:hypothetical protein